MVQLEHGLRARTAVHRDDALALDAGAVEVTRPRERVAPAEHRADERLLPRGEHARRSARMLTAARDGKKSGEEVTLHG